MSGKTRRPPRPSSQTGMMSREEFLQRQDSFETDPDLTAETDIAMHVAGSSALPSRRLPRASDWPVNAAVKTSMPTKSRARQRKEYEPPPFLSLDMITPDGSHMYYENIENVIQPKKKSAGKQRITDLESKSFHGYTKFERSRTTPELMQRQSPAFRLPSRALTRSYTQVKSPFKQTSNLTNQKQDAQGTATPSLGLKQRTAVAIHHVGQALSKEENSETKKKAGRLLKARLKPLYPVNVSGPSIHQCRGIQPDPRRYSPSPSRTLQRRRFIMTNTLYERPRTVESIHQTSVASSISDFEGDQNLEDFDVAEEINEEQLQADIVEEDDTGVNEAEVTTCGHLSEVVPVPVEGLQMPPNSLASIPYDGVKASHDFGAHVDCDCMQLEVSQTVPSQALTDEPQNAEKEEILPDPNQHVEPAAEELRNEPIPEHSEILHEDDTETDPQALNVECKAPDDEKENTYTVEQNDMKEVNEMKENNTGKSALEVENPASPENRPQTVSDPQGKRSVTFADTPVRARPKSAGAKMQRSKVKQDQRNKPTSRKKVSKESCKENEPMNTRKDDDGDDDHRGDDRNEDRSNDYPGQSSRTNGSAGQTSVLPSADKNSDQPKQTDQVSNLLRASVTFTNEKVKDAKEKLGSKTKARPRSGLAFKEFATVPVIETESSFSVVGRQSPTKEISGSCLEENKTDRFDARACAGPNLSAKPPRPKSASAASEADNRQNPTNTEAYQCQFDSDRMVSEEARLSTKGSIYRGRPQSAVESRRSQSIPTLTRAERQSVAPGSRRAITVYGSGMYPLYHAGICISCNKYSYRILSTPVEGFEGHCDKCQKVPMSRPDSRCIEAETACEVTTTDVMVEESREDNDEDEIGLFTNIEDIEKSLSQVQQEIRQCISQIDTLENECVQERADSEEGRNETDEGVDERSLSEQELIMNLYLEKCGGAYGEISHVLLSDPNQADLEDDLNIEHITTITDESQQSHMSSQNDEKCGLAEDSENLEVVATQKTVYERSSDAGYHEDRPVAPYPPLCFSINARPPTGFLYYFAYGTEMNLQRLTTYIGREPTRMWGILYGFQIVFNKIGLYKEAGGFPNIEFNPFSSVEGYAHLITPEELEKLDQFVGYPQHYEHVMFPVWMVNSEHPDMHAVAQYCVPALLYIAQDPYIHTGERLDSSYAIQQCLKGSDKLSAAYTQHLQTLSVQS